MSSDAPFEPYSGPEVEGTPESCAEAHRTFMASRRSVREFSTEPVSEAVIRSIVATAAGAPSGANKQPWRFVCVQDPELKREIRLAAEAEERLFYEERAPQRWLDDLKPFETNAEKPFLETAPWLIAVFKESRGSDGSQRTMSRNRSASPRASSLAPSTTQAWWRSRTRHPPWSSLEQSWSARPTKNPSC